MPETADIAQLFCVYQHCSLLVRKCGIVWFPSLVTTVFCVTDRFHLCSLGKELLYTPHNTSVFW